jgi:hypothetical protein
MGIKFGGLDLAKRSDASSFVILELEDGVLHYFADKIWKHVNYKQVADDVSSYNKEYKLYRIGFDRSGVGDAVAELFTDPNMYEPIVTSAPKKIEIINLIQSLSQQKKLMLEKGGEIIKQISEQTWDYSDAGNILYRHPTGRHDDLFWALGYACYVAYPHVRGMVKPMMAIGKPDYRSLDDIIEDEIEIGLNTV